MITTFLIFKIKFNSVMTILKTVSLMQYCVLNGANREVHRLVFTIFTYIFLGVCVCVNDNDREKECYAEMNERNDIYVSKSR